MPTTAHGIPRIISIDHSENWRSFATMLFALEDADPGYMLLKRAELDYHTKLRFVAAWCAFYNLGIAAIACQYEGKKFWAYLRAVYPTAQRNSERRHFRGAAGMNAIDSWERMYKTPEDMIDSCWASSYLGVRQNMKDMAQMGDYFYWKLADIQDTVFAGSVGRGVDFTGCEKYMPKVPKQGAALINELESECFDLTLTMAKVTKHISKMKHPFNGRGMLLQEAETVCCVFKQHVSGKYRYGYRSAKAYRRLLSAKVQAPDTVKALLDGLYAGGVWDADNLDNVLRSMGHD